MPRVFLPGIGFRQSGVRLVETVQNEAGGSVLTLRDLIASADGTELTYDITYKDEGGDARAREAIVIRSGGREYELTSGSVALWSSDGIWLRSIRSSARVPATAGAVEVEIAISGLGEWRVTGQLIAFGRNTDSSDVEETDTHDGIIVRLHAFSLSREFAAVELSASTNAEGSLVEGIGALSTTRLATNALTLHDQALRLYREQPEYRPLDEAQPQGRHLGVFEPVPDDAREFRLEIPYVYVVEFNERCEFDVPVMTPTPMADSRYRARVLRTYLAPGTTDIPGAPFREPGLGIDIDFGGWQNGRRLLRPWQVLVDGVSRGMRYTNRFDTRAPEPVQQFEIPMRDAPNAARVTLMGALVQVHGPWVVCFRR